jgi:DNA (cytosine-5)-methyltransferase 1
MRDPRASSLHAYLDVLEAALPRVMLLENVKGIAYVEASGSRDEQALQVLEDGMKVINKRHGTAYQPAVFHLDAADYGVPQRRERVFVVASRNGRSISSPSPTHTAKDITDTALAPQATAWDAIGDLDIEDWDPSLAPKGQWAGLLPTIPEGKNYLFHTPRGDGQPLFGWRTRYWSFLLKLAKDRPSWTIQAQPGPATGPFHWRSRQLSIRELARLQTFPDEHEFAGSEHSGRRQVGNAVPVALGEVIGLQLRRESFNQQPGLLASTSTSYRTDCPPPEEITDVPRRYLRLCSPHADHPGPGRGPAAAERIPTA